MDFFDGEIQAMLNTTFQLGSKIASPYTPDQLRMAIVATNLKSLASTLLAADASPDININIKQLVLGILGTADFLEESLPSLDEIKRNTGKSEVVAGESEELL